ncbi:calcium/sodium antiporter [Temperatibacter marinus]|uniref:Calcium/sodium antiporter n=1 Tax=Temperatibacter marinus TaxID=1456591 RepID=A0AA52EDE5_9PROT|nr:calcium/sodium antiporter [Temperatibacter marinus]WND01633.1 calcium/sodium antiporter [Temperatibacter marinus]
MDYVQAIAGLVVLIIAGDILVRGGVSLARRYDISPMVIGLTIIAFGTSAPELMVGIDAVLNDAAGLALGNVVGSNIANVLLVIGVPALIAPIACNAPRLGRNYFIMAAVTLIFIMMAQTGNFKWPQGMILLALLATFLYYSATRSKQCSESIDPLTEIDGLEDEPDSVTKASFFTIIGLIGLAFGADLLVTGSVSIARELDVSEEVIGLTMVAIGTSLPELVTSVTAALRGHSDVAVGNVIGSNIFNLLAIIGVSSLFGEIPVSNNAKQVDLWVMLASVIALAPFIALKTKVKKTAGIMMLFGYTAYIFHLAQSSL